MNIEITHRKLIDDILSEYGLASGRDEWMADLLNDLDNLVTRVADTEFYAGYNEGYALGLAI